MGLHGFEGCFDPQRGCTLFHPLTETSDIGQAQEFRWLLTGRFCGGWVGLMGEGVFRQIFKEAIGLDNILHVPEFWLFGDGGTNVLWWWWEWKRM